MKEWLTAQEIAEERLPDLPRSKQGVNFLAQREFRAYDHLCSRKRSGRAGGGGMEYKVSLLPLTARVAYQEKYLRVGIVDLPPAANDAPIQVSPGKLTKKEALQRDARAAIVKHFERFVAGVGVRQMSALQLFTDRYNHRTFSIEPWIIEVIPRLTKANLQRWRTKAKKGVALAGDKGAGRRGKGVLETANNGLVKDFILALIASKPHLSAEEIQRQLRAQFGDTIEAVLKGVSENVAVPPVRTIQHFVKALKVTHKAELLKLTNPDLFRSTMAMSGTGALRHITTPNSFWQIDASPIDAICTDGRHSVYACIDIATRRTSWYVSKTPKAEAVGLLIRKAILAWGVPDEIKTDNGSDFVALATRRLLAALGITLSVSDAYAPEQKGHVERVIQTLQHGLIEIVPGYVGHSVADRKAIESRKSFATRLGEDDAAVFEVGLSAAELQGVIDRWSETLYAHRPHAGLKGKTPATVAAAGDHTVRRVDERALDMLLAPVVGRNGIRAVTKFGIRVDHHHYLSDRSDILPGREVFVRRDPADIGRVLLFDPRDDRFLDEAICAELAGIDPRTWLKAKKELRAEVLRDGLAKIRVGMRDLAKGPALHERALQVAARDIPNVVGLPRPEVEHSTPQIASALDAATHHERKHRAEPLSDKAAALHAQMLAEAESAVAKAMPAANVIPLRKTEMPALRFRRALDLEARRAAGEAIGEDDAMWLGGYMAGSEYRMQRQMYDDFGGEISL